DRLADLVHGVLDHDVHAHEALVATGAGHAVERGPQGHAGLAVEEDLAAQRLDLDGAPPRALRRPGRVRLARRVGAGELDAPGRPAGHVRGAAVAHGQARGQELEVPGELGVHVVAQARGLVLVAGRTAVERAVARAQVQV